VKIIGAVLEATGMPAPYAASRPVRIAELDLDAPGPTELLVELECAGLCHSDLSVVNGTRARPVPMLLGHEAAGIVREVGAEVTDLREGQRVVMTFLPRCGRCSACATDGRLPCVEGSRANTAGTLLSGAVRLSRSGEPVLHHLGVSAFASHAVVDRRSVVPVDDDVPAEVAAVLGCAVLTGGGAVVNAGRPLPGQRVAVVGLGGVGMAALLTALASGDNEVVGIDTIPEKLAQASALGATQAWTPAQAVEAEFTADVVIEAAGSGRAFEGAVKLTAPGGVTVTVGLPAPTDLSAISALGLVAEARTIVGSYLGSAVPERDIPRYVELWRAGRLPVESLVSHRISLHDLNEGMDDLAAGRAVRQIIELGKGGAQPRRMLPIAAPTAPAPKAVPVLSDPPTDPDSPRP
jgi:alcohol dehydrogenase